MHPYGTTRGGSLFREYREADPSQPLVHEETLFRATRANRASRSPVGSPSRTFDESNDLDGFTKELRDLLELLQTPAGLKLYKIAYRRNMLHKIRTYAELHAEAEVRAETEERVLRIKTPQLKKIAGVSNDNDNWNIFESIGVQYREAKDQASRFEALRIRAEQSLEGSMGVDEVRSNDVIRSLRDQLVEALLHLIDFSSQPHVVGKTVELVSSFLKDPALFRKKMMNFMLMGGAGTGKTTLAQAMSRVFAKAGIFVGDRCVEAGRSDLVAGYEGQTVSRTKAFLVENLDNGVIFIDEAYAITPWNEGKPEGYGAEATTAMVEFMTKFKGLYCIIVAGYETQMVRYFLPTNEGLSRRFPNKFVLNSYSPDELLVVFLKQLLVQQDLPVPHGRDEQLPSASYFTEEALAYLRDLIQTCTAGTIEYREEYDPGTRRTYSNVRSFKPTWDLMYVLFENQAGSMTNIAEEALGVLANRVTFQDVIAAQKKNPGVTTQLMPPTQEREAMRVVIERSVARVALSEKDHFLEQLDRVESTL